MTGNLCSVCQYLYVLSLLKNYIPPKRHFSTQVPITCQQDEHAKKMSEEKFKVVQRSGCLTAFGNLLTKGRIKYGVNGIR